MRAQSWRRFRRDFGRSWYGLLADEFPYKLQILHYFSISWPISWPIIHPLKYQSFPKVEAISPSVDTRGLTGSGLGRSTRPDESRSTARMVATKSLWLDYMHRKTPIPIHVTADLYKSTPPLRCTPLLVNTIDVEPLGVEDTTNPVQQCGELLMLRVTDGGAEIFIAMRAADILWWAGMFASGANWEWLLKFAPSDWHGLHDDSVPPAVAHVIVVFEFASATQISDECPDGDAALVPIVCRVVIKANFLDPPFRRDNLASGVEFMRVRIRPPHDPLKIVVQTRKRPVIGHDDSPPDQRIDI